MPRGAAARRPVQSRVTLIALAVPVTFVLLVHALQLLSPSRYAPVPLGMDVEWMRSVWAREDREWAGPETLAQGVERAGDGVVEAYTVQARIVLGAPLALARDKDLVRAVGQLARVQ